MEKNSALERQRKGEFTAISVSTLKRWKNNIHNRIWNVELDFLGLLKKQERKEIGRRAWGRQMMN